MKPKELSKRLAELRRASYAPPDGGICDFCIVHDGKEWHLFHIHFEFAKPVSCMAPGQGDHLGHATSPDLITWTEQPPALIARTGKWDGAHLWAPHVVRHDGRWYMCYTGVEDNLAQHIGVVVSDDLWHWDYPGGQPGIDAIKYPWSSPGPIYEAKDGSGYINCRDPYLFFHDDRWLCYYTAGTRKEEEETCVIALASSDDLLSWKDEGYVLERPILGGEAWGTHQAESPCVFQHDGLFYLMYNQGPGMRYTWSTNPCDFTQNPVRPFMDGIFNFELIDLTAGLFAFGTWGLFSSLRLGTFHIDEQQTLTMVFD